MSRGPGTIERQLRDIFAQEPKGVFTTGMLCRRVYRVKEVRKKHRVAVLRALKRLTKRSLPTLWRRVQKYDRDNLWFDHRVYPSRVGASATAPRPRK
jgi:hypothetical protein